MTRSTGADEELTKRAAEQVGGGLLIHPVVGVTKPGDVDHFTRVRCYRTLVDNDYKPGPVVLSLLPLALRMAGPREVLLHAILRRNYGCTHLIVGRDHAGPGHDRTGQPFYGPTAAQESLASHQAELGIAMVDAKPMVYLPDEGRYAPIDEVPAGVRTAEISATQVRDQYLAKGPTPRVVQPPRRRRDPQRIQPAQIPPGTDDLVHRPLGVGQKHCGPRPGRASGRVRSERLAARRRRDPQPTSPKGSGFSKEDRNANINRVGYVAGLVAQHGGTTLCAVISPYREIRDNARKSSKGNFVEVFCDTPIEVCEQRDVKGLYAKARAGEIQGFTGVDDPYEAPLNPEVTLDTSKLGRLAHARRCDHREADRAGLHPAARPHR